MATAMKTSCCQARIVKSALRGLYYCKTCKRILNDDLFESQSHETKPTPPRQQTPLRGKIP